MCFFKERSVGSFTWSCQNQGLKFTVDLLCGKHSDRPCACIPSTPNLHRNLVKMNRQNDIKSPVGAQRSGNWGSQDSHSALCELRMHMLTIYAHYFSSKYTAGAKGENVVEDLTVILSCLQKIYMWKWMQILTGNI